MSYEQHFTVSSLGKKSQANIRKYWQKFLDELKLDMHHSLNDIQVNTIQTPFSSTRTHKIYHLLYLT